MQLEFIFLNLAMIQYCPRSAVVCLPFCMRKVRGSNPLEVKVFFSSISWGTQVQILAKIAILQQPATNMPPPSGGLYGHPEQPQGGGEQRKAAEIGLKCKINSKNALLLHRKNEKFNFFKNPSFKFEKLLVAYCPHVWVWKTSVRSLLNFFPY